MENSGKAASNSLSSEQLSAVVDCLSALADRQVRARRDRKRQFTHVIDPPAAEAVNPERLPGIEPAPRSERAVPVCTSLP